MFTWAILKCVECVRDAGGKGCGLVGKCYCEEGEGRGASVEEPKPDSS